MVSFLSGFKIIEETFSKSGESIFLASSRITSDISSVVYSVQVPKYGAERDKKGDICSVIEKRWYLSVSNDLLFFNKNIDSVGQAGILNKTS